MVKEGNAFVRRCTRLKSQNRDINNAMIGFRKWQVIVKVCSCHEKKFAIITTCAFSYNGDAVLFLKLDFRPSWEKSFFLDMI